MVPALLLSHGLLRSLDGGRVATNRALLLLAVLGDVIELHHMGSPSDTGRSR